MRNIGAVTCPLGRGLRIVNFKVAVNFFLQIEESRIIHVHVKLTIGPLAYDCHLMKSRKQQ